MEMGLGKLIVFTGGVGTGKSTAAQEMLRLLGGEEMGVGYFSADAAVHECLTKKEVAALVVNAFGQVVLDQEGKIDKKQLAELVFSDQNKLKTLESILHPLVKKRCLEAREELLVSIDTRLQPMREQGLLETGEYAGVLIAEIPLYFETAEQGEMTRASALDINSSSHHARTEMSYDPDLVVVVGASKKTQIQRLVSDRQWTEAQARERMEKQLQIELKMEKADVVLWNEGSKSHMVDQLWAVRSLL